MHYAKAGDVITVIVETSELVLDSIAVSLEVVDVSYPAQAAASRCSLLGLVGCSIDGSEDMVCATECPAGSDRGCVDGVCTRAMTVTAEPVLNAGEAACSMFGMRQCGVVDGAPVAYRTRLNAPGDNESS